MKILKIKKKSQLIPLLVMGLMPGFFLVVDLSSLGFGYDFIDHYIVFVLFLFLLELFNRKGCYIIEGDYFSYCIFDVYKFYTREFDDLLIKEDAVYLIRKGRLVKKIEKRHVENFYLLKSYAKGRL